jgi:hypothetical protein
MPPRRALAVAVVLALSMGALAPAPSPAGVRAGVYRGLGTWVDMFDVPPWRYPMATVRGMNRRGVRTLYVQTSNYRKRTAIYRPRQLAKMVDEAHRLGINVVAWYLPGFDNPRRDMRRVRKAINFETPAGNRFHSFALDIEATVVRDMSVRNRRAIRLSRRIRNFAGPAYPLGAIVPEARALYWPGFPYRELAPYYDAFLPMAYFTHRVSGRNAVYQWVSDNVRAIRQGTGNRRVPIHVIGGIAGRGTPREVRGYVDAVLDRNVAGGSLYDYPITTDREWRILSRIPNP